MVDSKDYDRGNPQQVSQLDSKMIPKSLEDWENHQRLKSAIRHGRAEEAKRLLQKGVPVNVNPDKIPRGYRLVTPLHLAVCHGDLDLIKTLLSRGASVCTADEFSETPLMLSVRLRKYDVTDLLLTADTIDDLRYESETINHLHIACLRNNYSVVKELIALGEDVNKAVGNEYLYWTGYTPLHFAVESHSVEIVKLLVDNGAEIMKKNSNSFTPLHLADQVRNEAIIDILLSAQMFELGNPEDRHGMSHFHIACTMNNETVVEFFLRQGVDIHSRVSKDRNRCSKYEPLTFAIYYQCPNVVKLLLSNGANLRYRYDPEEEYVGLAYEIGNQEVIDLLMNHRTLKNGDISKSCELSEFQIACFKSDIASIGTLLSQSHKKFAPDLNLCLWNGCTPLHFLVKSFPKKVMKISREFEVDMSIKDPRKKTLLHIYFDYCFDEQNPFIPSELLDFEKNPSDSYGLTHLHIACTTNRVHSVEKFLKNGADINCTVSRNSVKWAGYTPLHFAVQYLQFEIVNLLLKYGARISSRNGMDETSFDMAVLSLNMVHFDDNPSRGFEIIYKMLSTEKRPWDVFNRRGFSSLHIVCAISKKFDPVQLSNYLELLPDGIDQMIDSPESKYHQYTPLHFAMEKNDNNEFAKWLVQKGANIHLKDCNGYSPLEHELRFEGLYGIIENDPELIRVAENPFGLDGLSYFHHACVINDRETMEFYVLSGVDIDLRTKICGANTCGGENPLHLLLEEQSDNLAQSVKFLMDNGTNVMARDAYLNTPLQAMEYYFDKDVAELLLDRGADVNAENIFGETSLYQASSQFDASEKIRFLLDNGADINIETDYGKTPLTDTCDSLLEGRLASEDIVLILLKHAKKLMIIGLHVSDKNRNMYTEFFELENIDNFHEPTFEEECLREIELLKSFNVNHYTSMYDVIFKNSHSMAYLSQNASFRESIDSTDFNSYFPNYGYLIKLQRKKGLFRRSLLEKCERSLKCMLTFSTELVEEILQYLDNTDLQNIIASG